MRATDRPDCSREAEDALGQLQTQNILKAFMTLSHKVKCILHDNNLNY